MELLYRNIIYFIVGGALSAVVAAVVKLRESGDIVKRNEFNVLRDALDELQEENNRLRSRIEELENVIREYVNGISMLLTQIATMGVNPVWSPKGVEIDKDKIARGGSVW